MTELSAEIAHLSSQLTPALAHDLTNNPLSARSIDAAVLMIEGSYYYQRRIPGNPNRYTYKCLSPEQLAIAFANGNLDSGWMPPGVMRYGRSTKGNWGIYYIAAKKHTLIISDRLYEVPLPPLVWIGFNSNYWVVAIKGRFTPNAIVYHAPLPNVYDEGQICWGSNTPPSLQINSAEALVKAWTLFKESPFNNHLSVHKSRAYSSDVREMLNHLIQSKAKKYPTDDLILLADKKLTIETFIERKLKLDANQP
jgi:PRTRC genetic system protein B